MKTITPSCRELTQVIAVRHGAYNDQTRDLNELGRNQVHKLAHTLRRRIEEKEVVEVFSSPAQRAQTSAAIIAKEFGISHMVCDALRSDNYEDGDYLMNALLAKRNGSTVIIAVAHHKAPSEIIHAFARRDFKTSVRCFESAKGDGCSICLKTGTISLSVLAP